MSAIGKKRTSAFVSCMFGVFIVMAVPVWAQALDCASAVRIMPLGDSITYGTFGVNDTRPDEYIAGYRQELYLRLIEGDYNVRFVGSLRAGQLVVPGFDSFHEGHPGARDEGVAANIYDWLSKNPADVVLLHIGTNDLMINPWDTTPDDVEAVLENIDLYSRDIIVVLALIINRTAYSPETTQFNNNVKAMAERRIREGDKIVVADMEAGLDYSTDMADNLHPNEAGYEAMAMAWENALEGVLPYCGNNPPSMPQLVYPADKQNVSSTTVTFRWKKCSDSDGDTLRYEFYCCENPDFNGCLPVRISSATSPVYAGYGLFLFGVMIAACLAAGRKKLWYPVVIFMAAGFLLIASCGGGGGSGAIDGGSNPGPNPADNPDEVTHTAILKPATSYSWKVVAADSKGGQAESGKRTFTTP